MSILLKNLPREELPRERLKLYGASNLSNVELVSIILRTGTKGYSVKSLSEEILKTCNSISELKNLTINRLCKIKGLGNAKSISLIAALELGRRVYETDKIQESIKINNSLDAYRYFGRMIANEKQENFLVIYLDCQKKYITHKILFKGTLTESLVHPREIFKEAFLESAHAVILMHNHPSGKVVPSKADDEVTSTVTQVGSMMGIQVLDHLIIGSNEYYSYVEEGRLIHA